MAKIYHIIKRLNIILQWTKSYAKLALLYAEDLSILNHRWHQKTPKCSQKIDDIDSDMCYSWFGLGHYDVSCLYLLWRIPDIFRASSGQVFSGEECFIITIFHMRKGSPFIEMAETFGGDACDFWKKIISWLIIYIAYFTTRLQEPVWGSGFLSMCIIVIS